MGKIIKVLESEYITQDNRKDFEKDFPVKLLSGIGSINPEDVNIKSISQQANLLICEIDQGRGSGGPIPDLQSVFEAVEYLRSTLPSHLQIILDLAAGEIIVESFKKVIRAAIDYARDSGRKYFDSADKDRDDSLIIQFIVKFDEERYFSYRLFNYFSYEDKVRASTSIVEHATEYARKNPNTLKATFIYDRKDNTWYNLL